MSGPTREDVIAALGAVKDPEIGLDVVSLGLVYGVTVRGGDVDVDLALTSAACPMGEELCAEARAALRRLPGAAEVRVRLVWDPPWSPDRMSEGARRALGWR